MVMLPVQRSRTYARLAIESLYDGVCDVYQFTETYDANQHRNRVSKKMLAEKMPCRISINGSSPTSESNMVAQKVQTITLYCAPELTIPAGCKIEVTQAGRTELYEASGQPRVYPTHQELGLIMSEDKA